MEDNKKEIIQLILLFILVLMNWFLLYLILSE